LKDFWNDSLREIIQ